MTTVFIAGSIGIKHLDPMVKLRIDNIISSGFDVVVGDADGTDTSIQQYLLDQGSDRTTVFCTGTSPRNNVGDWPVHMVESKHAAGSRAFFTAKDLRMAEIADVGLMIWDAKSTGTLSNVIELLSKGKKSLVFVNKEKEFAAISNVEQLEVLVSCMSEHALRKAEEKIRLTQRIEALKYVQTQMFA